VIRRAYGSAVIAVTLRRQRKVPFLPREDLERLRDRRARRIARYAVAHVPFYKDLDARAIRTADDLAQWPVVDRDLARSRPELFVADTRAARDALAFTTSGTTGTPLQVSHDRRSVLQNFAYGERERAPVIAITGAGFRPSELYVNYETSPMRRVSRFYLDNTLMPVKPRRAFVSITTPIEDVAELMRTVRPDVLTGYGGWVDLFFRTVAARGLDIPRPKVVMYMAEALPPGARELIEGAFGIPVLSRYSAAESFKIGFVCEERRGFHLHEDLCHVRTDADGRILLSNLVNRATVLLNYPIGDVGVLSAEPCPCGRTLRSLSELEGRVEDILTLADGRAVHPRTVWAVFKDDRDVLQYQLTQLGPDHFTLRLATDDEQAFTRASARAQAGLRRLLGDGARIDVSRREELEHRTGKFRAVASAPTARGTAPDRAATTPPPSTGPGTAP
jgi:phenylacetate-CoA ligase